MAAVWGDRSGAGVSRVRGAATIGGVLPQWLFQPESVSGIPIDLAVVSSHIYAAICKRFRVSVRAAYTPQHGIRVVENHDNLVARIDANISQAAIEALRSDGSLATIGRSAHCRVEQFRPWIDNL
jgi:hypothetical protein